MSVPFVDLKATYAEIEAEVEAALHDVMTRGAFILGLELVEFESAFAGFCEAEACVGVENGTTALSSTIFGQSSAARYRARSLGATRVGVLIATSRTLFPTNGM